ncbi:hypothetical protein PG593_03590 [Riemerella anatipestifer]|uniref:hypothetical protein n=1 Tax=Riemerella anatipestifer TaxID=34085 RepID=UPI00069ADCE8|nr:hypothetical protein [Riemerella anatipestifer]MDR7693397.1 hypothetical protein [Riemerella anatipestifer]MDY3528862.1 hypothetical protein [Riemerella anatipestifer]MDY3538077.1 hypothetical protein [Riemerella anatipestifer]
MKYQIIISTAFFLIYISAKSQVKKLNDPAIVAQHKRMVFEKWGDFRPYPKYFLGVQTNFAYATIWGNWSPRRNRAYKNGADIRPLKANGVEVQRLVELEVQKKEVEKIKVEVDTIYKRNIQDFAHWTSATVEADPLWILYYKRMLNPLKSFPETPRNYREWGFDNAEIYETLKFSGGIEKLQESLDLLKDKYHKSRTMDMPRGKRFLMYHETLLGWRKFQSELFSYNTKSELFLDYQKALDKFRKGRKNHIVKSDVEIVREIMNQYKNQY